VIGDARLNRLAGRTRVAELDQHFRDVPDAGAERTGALVPPRIVREQLAIFLHRRPATRGVDDDAIDRFAFEDLDGSPRQVARLIDVAGVQRQCSTAPLRARGAHRHSLPPPGHGIVAALTWSNAIRCTQPVRTATFMRSWPTAGVCAGDARDERPLKRDLRRQRQRCATRANAPVPSLLHQSAAERSSGVTERCERRQRHAQAPGIRQAATSAAHETRDRARPRMVAARSARGCVR
jgi:hypothetical protein